MGLALLLGHGPIVTLRGGAGIEISVTIGPWAGSLEGAGEGMAALRPRERLTLEAIQQGGVTQASIMNITGYCRSTVHTALRGLQRKGLVWEKDSRPKEYRPRGGHIEGDQD